MRIAAELIQTFSEKIHTKEKTESNGKETLPIFYPCSSKVNFQQQILHATYYVYSYMLHIAPSSLCIIHEAILIHIEVWV